MVNFIAYNPVKLFFGKRVIEKLPEELPKNGKKAIIISGKESVKKHGYFDDLIKQLKDAKWEYIEYTGIKPNPIVEDVEKAVEIIKKEKIDLIIAMGGGSVIDTAKVVSIAAGSNLPAWKLMKREIEPIKAIPLLTILTLAATGTEMNAAAVIQNHQTQEKIGLFHPLMYPKASFLDPSYTLSVPKNQTINGIIDLTAHSLEAYFGDGNAPLSDRLAVANILEAFDYSGDLLNNLSNYDLRARMMWNATVAENGTTMHGREFTGDWGPHALAHHISLLWDTPHGQTLSIIFPAWMKVMKNEIPERIAHLGELLTGKKETTADDTIAIFEMFFKALGAPLSMKEIGLGEIEKNKLLALWETNKPTGLNIKLNNQHYKSIIKLI
jgi:alcohol dehydrogenase YqhD (iron-dependent ADH family)